MLKKYYLAGFFWASILVKRYQNMSGFASSICKFWSEQTQSMKKKKKLNPIYIRENNLVSRQFMCMCSSSKTVFIKIGICILKSFLTTTARVLFLFLRLGKRNLSYFGIHSVHRRVNPPSKTPPPLSYQVPLNLQNIQAPLFRQSPLYISFL